MTKHLLLVGSYTAAISASLEMGFRVTHLDDVRAVRPHHVGRTPRMILIDFSNRRELLDIAAAVHQMDPIDLVVSMQEDSLVAAAEIKEHLGVSGLNRTAVSRTHDKALMRKAMADAGLISTVPFMVLTDDRDATMQWAARVGFPIISKPIDGSGSRDIGLHHDLAELAALRWAPQQDMLLEKYIVGPEFSLEAISFAGRHILVAVTDKIVSTDGHFVEMGHSQPSRLGPIEFALIEVELDRFLDAMGVVDGVTHTEIKFDGHRVYVVESHTRPGGDRILEITRASTGVDMAKACLAAFAGEPAESYLPNPPVGVVSRYFALDSAEISAVVGLDELADDPSVLMFDFPYGVGATPPPITSSDSRHGYLICRAATVQEAGEAADRLVASVKVAYSE